MYRENKKERERRAVAHEARRYAVLWRRYTSRRARFYLRIAADDPPEHPARPPSVFCTLIKPRSTAPPNNTPVYAGEARAGPWPIRFCVGKGGDG